MKLCERHKWIKPCPAICGEMCVWWLSDKCLLDNNKARTEVKKRRANCRVSSDNKINKPISSVDIDGKDKKIAELEAVIEDHEDNKAIYYVMPKVKAPRDDYYQRTCDKCHAPIAVPDHGIPFLPARYDSSKVDELEAEKKELRDRVIEIESKNLDQWNEIRNQEQVLAIANNKVKKLEAINSLAYENLNIWLNSNKKHICMGEPQRKQFNEITKALKGGDGK